MIKDPKGNKDKFEISKGVDIPKSRGHTKPLKYPWDKMEVGDSILITGAFNKREGARSSAYAYGKRKGLLFTSRVEGENKLRIWRTK